MPGDGVQSPPIAGAGSTAWVGTPLMKESEDPRGVRVEGAPLGTVFLVLSCPPARPGAYVTFVLPAAHSANTPGRRVPGPVMPAGTQATGFLS